MTAVALYVLLHACTCDAPVPISVITTHHPHRDCAIAARHIERTARAKYGAHVIAYCHTTMAPLTSLTPKERP